MSGDAQRVYDAFRSIVSVDANGVPLPALEDLADGGAGWFAVVNARDEIASPPTDTREPYDLELREIEKRFDDEGDEIVEAADERPSKITIRANVADDLCVPSYGRAEFANDVFARTVGLPLDTVEWRLWPEDSESGKHLCAAASGMDGAEACVHAYINGGGTQAIGELEMYGGWQAAARELLTTYHDGFALVRCRTEGVGTLKVGPLRSGHLRIYQGVALSKTEWDGRLDALAKATGRDCRRLRVDDVQHLWGAFDTLKKKVEAKTNTIVGARLSSPSSTDGPKTSTS
jgi:hypothetical protein